MDVRFSPDGTFIAVASNDNYIDIYESKPSGKTLTRKGTFKGHSSFITHVDWSADGKFLQSNSGVHASMRTTAVGEAHERRATIRRRGAQVTWSCSSGSSRALGRPPRTR